MNKEIENICKNCYENNDNYKVINGKGTICYIFISSNGLFRDDGVSLRNCIDKNHFEWENISKSKCIRKNAKKMIFIRDIFKHSYVDGINSKINSIPEIIKFLKKETAGMPIYTVGNSGGGYLSFILSAELENVKRVYSFGGVVSLYKWGGSDNTYRFEEADHLYCHMHDSKSLFFDTTKFLKKTNAYVYHFYSSKNESDCIQAEILKQLNEDSVYLFGFDSAIHGNSVNSIDIPKLLSCNLKHFNKIIFKFNKKQNIRKNHFSFFNLNIFQLVFACCKKFFHRFTHFK